MMTQQRVDTYLDRLEKELSDLPRDRRRELVDEIRGHIDEALTLTPDPGEADVRNILERLGDPADIAAEALERFGVRRAIPTWREWAAVVLLPFGGLLVLVLGIVGTLGWILGAIFLLTSRIWTIRDRAIGLLLFPGGLLLPLACSWRRGKRASPRPPTVTRLSPAPDTRCPPLWASRS